MKKALKLCVVAIVLVFALTLALVSCITPGSTEKYTITYIDAPTHNNPTTYTSNDYIKLQKPMWTGLAFSHWSDEEGNAVTEIPRGTTGNITLTANWTYTENMIVSNDSNDMLFSLYDEEHNQRYFVYEIGTMHNVVLDELSSYRYNGATEHTWSISETVSFTESSAENIANTIADIVTDSTSWSDTHTDITENSTTRHQSVSIAPEIGIKAVKIKLGEYYQGKDSFSSDGDTDAHYDGGGKDTTHDESKTVSSTISYIKDVSTQVTRTETLDPSITPAGMYRYVQAGSVKVYAIITYNQDTEDYFINIYSYIDKTYETMLYEPIPEYNGDINVVESAPFEFDLNIDELAENVIGNAYYVEFNANGGAGSMPTQMILPDSNTALLENRFTREGYEFIGWSLMEDDSGVIYSDGQTVNGIANAQETVTLYAVWSSITYTVVYDANGGFGEMPSTIHLIDSEDKLLENTYVREGYLFDGWSTKADGTGVYFEDEALIKDISPAGETIVLHAIWASKSLTYALSQDASVLAVNGIDPCTDTDIIIPHKHLGYPVTRIADRAFCDDDNFITSVVIPNSVTSIGVASFGGCTALKSISIPDSVTSIGDSAFNYCESLTSIVIPDSVTSIAEYTFNGCTSLTSIVIPNSVTEIEKNAFSHCTSLTNIEIPDSVTSIGDYAFFKCTTLANIEIPDSVTSIGDDAFSYCESLASIVIPDSVTSIGEYTFLRCYSLANIEIPDSVTSIGNSAFSVCSSLTSIVIPEFVTSIGNQTFMGCTSLINIEVDENNAYYRSIDGNLYTKDGKTFMQYAIGKKGTSFTIPDSVTSIGDSAFYCCESLTSIVIPDFVTSICEWAFRGCSSLTSITFEGTVEQWNDITKGDDWNLYVPAKEVVCSNGTVSLK